MSAIHITMLSLIMIQFTWNGKMYICNHFMLHMLSQHQLHKVHFTRTWHYIVLVKCNHYKHSTHISYTQLLASFSGSCAWAEKKKPDTHCLSMLSSPRISVSFGNFRKTCPITLTSARHADFSHTRCACHSPHSVWMMTKQQ